MGGITRVEESETCTVQEYPVEMVVVEVLAVLTRVATEVEQALVLVHLDDAAGTEGAACDGVLELAVFAVEIEVAPATAFAPPD